MFRPLCEDAITKLPFWGHYNSLITGVWDHDLANGQQNTMTQP